jgi:hypothetical protein
MSVEKCEIKDQFCLTAAPRTCRECKQHVCKHCSVYQNGDPVCHPCLRTLGVGGLAESHLRAMGGLVKVAKQEPWKPVKQ